MAANSMAGEVAAPPETIGHDDRVARNGVRGAKEKGPMRGGKAKTVSSRMATSSGSGSIGEGR
jgi:hypothetical protein